jgi:hypothetical protein
MSTVEGGLTVIDWAGALITPANTIAAATAQVINAFISCLSSRSLVELVWLGQKPRRDVRLQNRQTDPAGQSHAGAVLAYAAYQGEAP